MERQSYLKDTGTCGRVVLVDCPGAVGDESMGNSPQ